ncbi:MAG: hypothetical protein E7422_07185 [Ruminococcaceae bacterium]|nr:hypothetical protein [Oscillospiraceae bacterium]
MKKRALSALLALCMALALLPWAAVPARAAVTRRQLMLGASGLIKDNIIYFGNEHDNEYQRSWRVLSPAGVNSTLPVSGTDRVLLISSVAREVINFDNASTAWADSNAQKWCKKFYTDNFNDLEKAAIAETTLDEQNDKTYQNKPYCYDYKYFHFAAAPLSADRLFFLSAEEAATYLKTNAARQPSGASAGWWLRSPEISTDSLLMGRVEGGGALATASLGYDNTYARPACNLDAASILFTQLADGITPAVNTVEKIQTTSDYSAWKLTLHDSSRDSFWAEVTASNASRSGGTVTIRYKNAKTDSNEYVSVLLCDETGAAVCYGVSAPLTNAGQSSGTVTFTLPENLDTKRYTLYVCNEQRNGAKFSNYASAFQETTLPVIGFGSGDSSVQNNTVRYSVQGAPKNALIIAARYDGGKMTDVQTLDLADDEAREGTLTLRGTGTGFKLFLVDKTTYAPLCPAVDGMSTSS